MALSAARQASFHRSSVSNGTEPPCAMEKCHVAEFETVKRACAPHRCENPRINNIPTPPHALCDPHLLYLSLRSLVIKLPSPLSGLLRRPVSAALFPTFPSDETPTVQRHDFSFGWLMVSKSTGMVCLHPFNPTPPAAYEAHFATTLDFAMSLSQSPGTNPLCLFCLPSSPPFRLLST